MTTSCFSSTSKRASTIWCRSFQPRCFVVNRSKSISDSGSLSPRAFEPKRMTSFTGNRSLRIRVASWMALFSFVFIFNSSKALNQITPSIDLCRARTPEAGEVLPGSMGVLSLDPCFWVRAGLRGKTLPTGSRSLRCPGPPSKMEAMNWAIAAGVKNCPMPARAVRSVESLTDWRIWSSACKGVMSASVAEKPLAPPSPWNSTCSAKSPNPDPIPLRTTDCLRPYKKPTAAPCV